MLRNRLFLLLSTVVLLATGSRALSQPVDSTESLQLAVRRMDAWLGTGPKAEGWRRALSIAALESQAARGLRADAGLLRQILQQFQAGHAGLEHPQFQEVRVALADHLRRLESSTSQDIPSLIAAARSNYRPITSGQVDRLRRDALAQLERMEREYLAWVPADVRDPLFKDLALDEILKILRETDFARLMPVAAAGSAEPAQRLPSEDTETEEQKQQREQEAAAQKEAAARQQDAAERDRVAERTRLLRTLVGQMRKFDSASLEQTDIWFYSAVVSLDRFTRALAAATSTRTEQEYYESLDLLEQNLPGLEAGNDRQAPVVVGEHLGRIAHALQAPDLVDAVRRKHCLPNAHAEIRVSLLDRNINRAGGDRRPVDEVILGRQIYGTADTRNQARLELLDDPHQVSASIHLEGSLTSQTWTSQGPVTAFAASQGQFEGRRNLYAGIGGFYTTDPYVAANLNSAFRGTDCRLRLVNRIATQQYLRDKTTSEGIAAARAERRILNEFSEQTARGLQDARGSLADSVPVLFDFARWVPDLSLSSHTGGVRAMATRSDPLRVAASSSPPSSRVSPDVRIALHQSMVGNYVDPILSGQRYSNEQLGDLFRKLGVDVPEAFQQKDKSESWTITFPPTGAVTALFGDQKVNLQVTGRRFSRDETEIDAMLHIRLEFSIVRREGKLFLVQSSPPVVDYADPSQMDGRVVGFKSFLEGKLQDSYDPAEGGIALPDSLIPLERIERPQLREAAAGLALAEARIESGWLMAGWNQSRAGVWSNIDTPAIAAWSPPPAVTPAPQPEEPALR